MPAPQHAGAAAAKADAVVVVVALDGRVLVIERGPDVARSGYWAPLSGRVEPGESQEHALVREVREEVGLDVRPVAKVWECDTDDGRYRLHWWTAVLRAGASAEWVLDPGEVSAARWIDPSEFDQLSPTFAGDRRFFTDVYPTIDRAD